MTQHAVAQAAAQQHSAQPTDVVHVPPSGPSKPADEAQVDVLVSNLQFELDALLLNETTDGTRFNELVRVYQRLTETDRPPNATDKFKADICGKSTFSRAMLLARTVI